MRCCWNTDWASVLAHRGGRPLGTDSWVEAYRKRQLRLVVQGRDDFLPGVGPEPHGGDLPACARPAVDRHQLVGRAGALGERAVLHGFRLVRAAAPAGGELGWPGDRARRDAGRTGSTATTSTRARPAIPRSISANSFRALQAGTRPHAPSAAKSSTRLKAARRSFGLRRSTTS